MLPRGAEVKNGLSFHIKCLQLSQVLQNAMAAYHRVIHCSQSLCLDLHTTCLLVLYRSLPLVFPVFKNFFQAL